MIIAYSENDLIWDMGILKCCLNGRLSLEYCCARYFSDQIVKFPEGCNIH